MASGVLLICWLVSMADCLRVGWLRKSAAQQEAQASGPTKEQKKVQAKVS